MLKMIKGAQVPNAEILNEGYEISKEIINYQSILMNINAYKIKKILEELKEEGLYSYKQTVTR